MRAKIFNLFSLIAIVLCISVVGCQKDYNPEVPEVPVVTDSTGTSTGDSIYVDKIFELYDEGMGIDTQLVSSLVYDSRKRVIEIHDSILSHPGTEPYKDFYFSYNGNDTVPFKTVYVDTYDAAATTIETNTTFHFYDASGKKTKDSLISVYVYPGGGSSNYSVTNFTYDGNKVYGSTSNETSSNPFFSGILRDTAVLDASGNILSSKRYLYDVATSNYQLSSSSAFTYDTHPHPFSKLSCFKYFFQFPNGETQFTQYAGFNNQLTQTESSDGGNTYNWVNTYTYKASGLPAIKIATYEDGDVTKVVFKYRAL